MSSHRNHPSCDDTLGDLSDFALGTIIGRRRSVVLDHIATCAPCRAEVDALSTVADTLLVLAPLEEPPAGFELATLRRWREGGSRNATRARRRAAILAGVAAGLVAVGFVLAVGNTNHSESYHAVSPPQSAVLTLAGTPRGHIWISAGSPSWIYMNIDSGHRSGRAWCRVTLRNGHVVDVGAFTLTHGEGYWSAEINNGGVRVSSALITDSHGFVLARANLST